MPRKVRDSQLETRTARGRLKVAHKPYFRLIEPGLHLGYRKLASGPGTWVVRRYSGAGAYSVENLRTPNGVVVIADDHSEADGHAVLSFGQAQERAKEQRPAPLAVSLTVRDAVTAYIAERDARDSKRKGREVRSDAGQRLRRYVLGQEARGKREAIPPAPLAAVGLHALEDTDLKAWRGALPDTLTTATKQRLVNDLKAALNGAYADNRKRLPATLPATIKFGLKAETAEDDDDTGVRENQILADAQVSRLIRAARELDADVFRLVVVLAATGARFSQVARMRVRDCQPGNRRLMVPTSRKGQGKKASHTTVPVGRDVIDALRPVLGRKPDTWLLERDRYMQVKGGKWEHNGRGPWLTSELTRPWQAVRERAKLPEVIPYALRHSSIVRGLRQGLPTRLVASLHDTSVQMIERHYSRWITVGLEQLAAKAVVPLVRP